MEILEESWQKLNLSNEEECKIEVDVGKLMEENGKGELSFIGKLYAEITISKEIIRNSMMKIWKTSKPFSVIDIKLNVKWVLERRPWLFEASLISL